ncbi:hypothetical protein LY78DRAFT_413184 [Colletotrichum sublineola]|nr:hypothetical protein LY78DRAFT_413184 [Colletotrichum sublineola]
MCRSCQGLSLEVRGSPEFEETNHALSNSACTQFVATILWSYPFHHVPLSACIDNWPLYHDVALDTFRCPPPSYRALRRERFHHISYLSVRFLLPFLRESIEKTLTGQYYSPCLAGALPRAQKTSTSMTRYVPLQSLFCWNCSLTLQFVNLAVVSVY